MMGHLLKLLIWGNKLYIFIFLVICYSGYFQVGYNSGRVHCVTLGYLVRGLCAPRIYPRVLLIPEYTLIEINEGAISRLCALVILSSPKLGFMLDLFCYKSVVLESRLGSVFWCSEVLL